MVGKKVESIFPKITCPIGDVVLKVENLSGDGFSNITFEVRAGEILGLSGLVGSGRSETACAIFGLRERRSGMIYLNGRNLKINKPIDAIQNGICMVFAKQNKKLAIVTAVFLNILDVKYMKF